MAVTVVCRSICAVCFPKETLILIDGKRFAFGSLGVAGSNQGQDINLIPFPMIDHIDILKDGASAVYGSDAVTGVVNFFLIHKFRGLEIGGSYGNTNLGASNEMGEWEAWLKAGTGDDKTDIVVVADFWQRTVAFSVAIATFLPTADFTRFGGFDSRSVNEPGRVGSFRLIPNCFLARALRRSTQLRTPRLLRFISDPQVPYSVTEIAVLYMGTCYPPVWMALILRRGDYFFLTLLLSRQRFHLLIAKPSTAPSCAMYATNT